MEDQASHLTETRTSVARAEECIVLFNALSEDQPQWSEDQLARFKIWIANLGVFEDGHASIDYRLRDHPDVLSLVTQQLDVLKINLEKLKSTTSEPVLPQIRRRGTSKSESFDIDGEVFVYESPTSETSSSSSDLKFERKGCLNPRLTEGLQIVEDTIARLNALSTAIRRSGKRSRTSKADLYEVIENVDGAKINVTKEFQKYASAVVAREIPCAEAFLKERLTTSITRQRNRFLYWKRHDKTSNIYVKKIMPSRLVKQLETTQQASMPKAEDSNVDKQKHTKEERTIMTGFTATTFDAKNFRNPTESARGSNKPTGSVQWKNRAEFPKPPKIETNESHFVCPICLILSPAKEARGDLWVQHVTRDLKPYICVFDGCKTPQNVFDNYQDWIEHMKEEQMAPEWYCASASHPPMRFKSQDLFESHMREQHPRGFMESQIPALAERNMRFASEVFNSCPFCSYNQDDDVITQSSTSRNQKELQYHISSHLLSLAFISLPPMKTGSSTESESGDSSRVATDSRIGHSETMELFRIDEISHNLDPIEDSIKLIDDSDWNWDFVWESLRSGSISNENSPDSIMRRLQEMQQKVHMKQNFTHDYEVERQQQKILENNPWASSEDDLKMKTIENYEFKDGDLGGGENTVIDGVLLSTVVEGVTASTQSKHEAYDDAERFQRQVVEDRQKLLGPSHPETLTSVDSLGQALFFQGKYKEAEVSYRKALAGRKKLLGLGHLDTIKSLNNLAQALVYLRKFKAGEELYRQALAEGEKTLGFEHPYVLQNIHNLGGALRKQGQYKEAETFYRQALVGREKVLGQDHPDTLQSVNNLGGIFERMGQYRAAEELYRQALTAREKVLGVKHADTLQSVHNIASALRNQGRNTEAENLYRKALAGREKVLGRNHPNTLKSLNNLALALEEQQKYIEAEQIYRHALALRMEVLGNEHPDTFQSIHNIGSVRLHQLDYVESELLYRQALEGRKRALGLEHPHTLTSISDLGNVLKKMDRFEEAEMLYRQALEGREKLLGPEHPHTKQSVEDLVLLLRRQGKL